MRGYAEFNFPAFNYATARLRAAGHEVFSPAERDNEKHGTDISRGNAAGSEKQATEEHGFSIREALAADCKWICETGTAIYMLKGWEKSRGAVAEHALALALGVITIWYQKGAVQP